MIKPKAIIESNRRYVLIPGAEDDGLLDSATLNLDFTGGRLDSRIDFQRTTVGTYYRGAFNQNLFTRSEAFNLSPWAVNGATVPSTNNTAPDGTATASNFVANSGSVQGFIFQGATINAGTVAISVYAKANGRDFFQIWQSQTTAFANFDLSAGVVGTNNSAVSHSITDVGGGWYRCACSFALSAGVVNFRFISCSSASAARGVAPLGDGTSGVLLWGAQLTEGSLLTPYIPTTTASITQGQIASSQPWNLFPRSQEFDVSPWASAVTGAGVSPVITANAAVAPDGTTTADQIDFNCGGLTLSDRCIRRQATSLSAATYTVSVWARSATGTTQHIQFHQDGGTSATTFAIGTSWQRITLTYTSVGGSLQTGLELRGNNTAGVTTSSIYVWGMQLNEGSSALDYRSTTSSALWLPRFENDPVTGQARGLLIEGGATNLCLRSAEFNTTWTAGNTTVSPDAITAPDGTVSADKVIANPTNGAHTIYQGISVTSGTVYTHSVFAKAAEYTKIRMVPQGTATLATIEFDLSAGTSTLISGTATHSITAIGNGWYRCVATTTATGTGTGYIQMNLIDGSGNATFAGNNVDGAYLWGAQVEAQAFASSYIPTVAATVTRGADSAVMTGTNFSSWYNQSGGTFFTEHNQGLPATGSTLRFVGAANSADGGITYVDLLRYQSNSARAIIAVSAVAQSNIASLATVANISKSAHAFAINSSALSCSGQAPVTDAPASLPTVDQLRIGALNSTTGPLNGNIRRIAYWPTRLPNATLQSLTT